MYIRGTCRASIVHILCSSKKGRGSERNKSLLSLLLLFLSAGPIVIFGDAQLMREAADMGDAFLVAITLFAPIARSFTRSYCIAVKLYTI